MNKVYADRKLFQSRSTIVRNIIQPTTEQLPIKPKPVRRHISLPKLTRLPRKFRSLRRWQQAGIALVFLATIIVPSFLWMLQTSALTQGPLATTSGADNAGVGTTNWSSTGSVTVEDANYATNTMATSAVVTVTTGHYLFATGFGFSIPTGSTINGITAEVKEQANTSATGQIKENSVRALKAGAVIGTDKSTAATFPATNSFVTYGSASDLWGTTWTVADVNAANFGVAVSPKNVRVGALGGTEVANIDFVKMTVSYTPPPTLASQNSYRIFNNQDAATATSFAKAIGGTGADIANAVTKTSDGGYVVAGSTPSFGAGGDDAILAKYDSAGTLSFSRTWGGTGTDQAESVIETRDGGYAMCGLTSSFGGGSNDVFFAVYDNSGSLSFSRTWGGTGSDVCESMIQAEDGSFILAGFTNSSASGTADSILIKYDLTGTFLFDRAWGGTGLDYARDVKITSDGGYLIAGQTTSFGAGMEDAFFAKYTSTGSVSFSRTWGGTNGDFATKIIQTSDGGYAISGFQLSFGAGLSDSFIAKYDSAATLTFSRTWGGTGNDYADGLAPIAAGGFALSGRTASFGAGLDDVSMAIFNSAGTLSYSRTFGGTANDRSYGIVQTTDLGFALAGTTASYGAGSDDLLLLKYDASGLIAGCGAGVCQSPTATVTSPVATAGSPTATNYGTTASSATPTPTSQSDVINYTSTATTIVATSPTGIDVGTALAAQSTAATAPTNGQFRLRMNVAISSYRLAKENSFVLQYALRGADNSCDTAFTSETYKNVTNSSPVSFYDNPNAGNGIGLTTNANDPTDGANVLVRQTYQDTAVSSFSAATTVPVGQDGMWDFSLKTSAQSFAGNRYCLRLVDGSGAALNAYTTVPEIIVPGTTLSQSNSRSYAQPTPVTFAKAWGGAGADSGSSSVQTSDGGYAVTGNTLSYGNGSNDMFLTKYDSAGNLSFSRTWGGAGSDYGTGVAQLTNGDFVVTGYTASYGAGANDAFVARYSSAGKLTGTKTWGGTGNDYGRAIVKTSDGGYAVTGNTYSYGDTTNGDAFLIKFNSSDGLTFSRTWGGTGIESSNSIIQTSDSGYAISGNTFSYGAGASDAFFAKYDSAGTLGISRTWGGTGSDIGQYIIQTSDGGYVIEGYTSSYGAGNSDVFFAKFTSAGALSFSRTLGSSSAEYSGGIGQTTDGGYILTGQTFGFGAGSDDVISAKYDATGALIFARTWGGAGSEGPTSLNLTSDGGFAVAGDTPSFGAGSNDMFLLKYDASGIIAGCNSTICQTVAPSVASPTATSTTPTPGTTSPAVTPGSPVAGITLPIPTTTDVVAPAGLANTFTFAKAWGGSSTESSYGVVKTSDGGYAVTGYTYSLGDSLGDMYLAKYDRAGVLDFSRTWGGSGADSGYALIQTSDGGYAVTGFTNSYGDLTNGDMFVAKFDKAGTLIFSRTWGGTSQDYGNSIAQTTDGGLVITGVTASFGGGGDDAFAAKYNSAGTLSFSRTWGGTGAETGFGVTATSDGGFAITGNTTSYGNGGNEVFLAKYDSAGTLGISRTWGGSSSETGNAIIQTSDGGYAITGNTTSFGAGGNDAFLAKFDSAGTLSFSRSWGDTASDLGNALLQLSDDSIIVAGQTASYGAGITDTFVAKYDSTGILLLSRTWGGTGADRAYGIAGDLTGGFAITGYSASFGAGSGDSFLVKYDTAGNVSGCSITNCQIAYPKTNSPTVFTITPTPGTSSPTATTSSPAAATMRDEINYDSVSSVVVASVTTAAVGNPYDVQNKAIPVPGLATPFHVRTNVNVAAYAVAPASLSLKLQYAVRGSDNQCDPAFVGDTYVDVTAATALRFYTDPRAANASSILGTTAADSITEGGSSVYTQQYVQSNNFTNSGPLLPGEFGTWDFSLITASNVSPGTVFCLRIVQSTGSTLASYSAIQELQYGPMTYQRLSRGKFFDTNGKLQPLFISR